MSNDSELWSSRMTIDVDERERPLLVWKREMLTPLLRNVWRRVVMWQE